MWARSGYYQPGGAFGFRDQLQDVMALRVSRARPAARAPPARGRAASSSRATCSTGGTSPRGRGTRTRCSDDLLWLPFAVAHYVRADRRRRRARRESCRSSRRRRSRPASTRPTCQPGVSAETASLFEHCLRAIDTGLTAGAHGLPLIGSGDWNDGMNRVGHAGTRRERLARLVPARRPAASSRRSARRAATRARAARYRGRGARACATMLELAWDGEWYRRGYYDDGTPLGSAQNDECRIDSIAQSWAVLSGAAPAPRAERAMDAVRTHLVRRGARRRPAPRRRRSTSSAQDPGLHQGLPAGHARERRPVHARRALGRHGDGPARAAATRRSSCSTC